MRRTIIVCWLVAGLLALPGADAAPGDCAERDLTVTISGAAVPYTVHGLLCDKPKRLPGTIQVLLAGATEGGLAYWDFPHPDFYRTDPASWRPVRAKHSYVEHLTNLGYASFTIDRIGTGESSRPPAEQVTIQSNAEVVHQVVTMLKDGTLGAFRNVVLVGRSLSGPIAFVEQATYHDTDGLIVQSWRHHQEPPFAEFAATFMPAQLEPRLRSTPPGYLTTKPGARARFFFSPDADPKVVGHEEAIRDTITDAEVATFPGSFDASESIDVDVPVLSVVGERDTLFCTPGCPRAQEEAASWPNQDCFTSVVVDGGSHDMNLERSGDTVVFPLLVGWIDDHFATGARACGDDG